MRRQTKPSAACEHDRLGSEQAGCVFGLCFAQTFFFYAWLYGA